jgi:hypothetical protein
VLSTRARHIGLLAAIVGSALVAGACLPAPGPDSPSGAPPSIVAGPSSGAPGTSPVAPPSPSPKTQDSAIEAFAKQVATGKLTYHVAFTGEVRASVNRLPITGAMDVAGNDFASSFTYDFNPDYPGLGKVKVQVRGVDDRAWIKRGSAGWAAVKTYGIDQSYVPFKTVAAPRDVKYLGPVKIASTTYYKVAVRDALLIHPNTIPYQIQREEVQATTLEVLIDDAGTPRSGSWELRGQARIGAGNGQLQHVVYDLTLTFSKVGSRISVKKP